MIRLDIILKSGIQIQYKLEALDKDSQIINQKNKQQISNKRHRVKHEDFTHPDSPPLPMDSGLSMLSLGVD